MFRTIAFALATTALAACANQAPPAPPAPIIAVAPAGSVAPVIAPAPRAQFGTFGFDSAGMDRSVPPGAPDHAG